MPTDQCDRPLRAAAEHARKEGEERKRVMTTALVAQSPEQVGGDPQVAMLVEYLKESPDRAPAPRWEETLETSRLTSTWDNLGDAGGRDNMEEAG